MIFDSSYKVGCVIEDEYKSHREHVDITREIKGNDKLSNDDCLVFTCDLEALLQTPFFEENMFYYKSKLNCHNMTFENLKDNSAINFLWTEIHGDMQGSVFVTIYVNWVECCYVEYPNTKSFILWSDNCIYQNNNKYLGGALK